MTHERLFNLIYHIKHDENGVTFESIPEGHGVADSMVVMAIIDQPENKKDVHCLALDGHAGASLGIGDMFSAWISFTSILFEQFPPTDLRKELLYEVLKNSKDLIDAIDREAAKRENGPLLSVVKVKDDE